MRKEKILHEIENERKKRKIAEEHAKKVSNEAKKCKKQTKKAHTLLSRIIKRRVGTKRSVKTKGSYSRQWKAKQKQQLTNEVNVTWDFLLQEGFLPKHLVVGDKYGNIHSAGSNAKECEHTKLSVDKSLFLKDRHCVPDVTYHEYGKQRVDTTLVVNSYQS